MSKGWPTEDEIRDAHRQAIKRRYQRLVEAGVMEDTSETWTGFVHGWFNEPQFTQAQRNLNQAGGPAAGFGVMMWTLALVFAALLAMSYFYTGEDLVMSRFYIGCGVSVGLAVLGAWLGKLGQRQAEKANKEFEAEWTLVKEDEA